MDALLVLAGAIVGGVGFRIRGAAIFTTWTGRGATTARIVAWATPMAIMSAIAGLGWWSITIGVAAWIGCLAPWWRSLTMGRDPAQGTYAVQFARHAARGVLWALPMVVVLAVAGREWWPLLLASFTCAPAYEAGYRIKAAWGTEIGEAVFGAFLGAALMLSICVAS